MRISGTGARAFAVVFACGAGGTAWAQEPATAGAEGVKDIVVTAQRRSERLQDVPLAVTALDGDALAEQGVRDLSDLSGDTPNLVINSPYGASNPSIYIRGVGVSDFNANSATAVGVYVDDAYVGSPAGLLFSLFDLERVEVLRGPQGTLYGRNTTGGAVNFISARPSKQLQAGARVRYGRFDEVSAEASLSGPLAGDALTARASGIINQRDGYVRNRIDGRRYNEVDNWAGRLQLRAEPSSSFSALLIVNAGRSDTSGSQYQHRGLFGPTGPCPTDAAVRGDCVDLLGYRDADRDVDRGDYNRAAREEVRIFGANLQLTLEMPWATLSSVTAFSRTERDVAEDTDASPNGILEIDWSDRSRQFSQELRLAGDAGQLTWVTGAFYYRDRVRAANAFDVLRAIRPLTGFQPGVSFRAAQDYVQRTEAVALFGQADFAFAPGAKAFVGLRYTDESRRLGEQVAFREPGIDVPVLDERRRTGVNNLSGRIGVQYEPVKDTLLYASASRGFKSGGFNGGIVFTPRELEPFDEETLTAYEVGVKSELFGRRLRANLAAFIYDYKDLQVFTVVNAGGVPTQVLDNAANARIGGVEAELTARPGAGFTLSASAGYLDTELKDYVAFAGIDPATGAVRTEDRSGNRLIAAPELSFSGAVAHEASLGSGTTLRSRVQGRYRSKAFYEATNDPRLAQDGFWTVDARVALGFSDDRYEVALWAENVGDKRALRAAYNLSNFGLNGLAYNAPRTYGVELRARY